MARNFVTNGRLNLGSAAVSATPLTLAAWVNPANITGNHVAVGMFQIDGVGSSADAWYLQFGGATGGDPVQAITAQTNTFAVASTATGFSANVWTHGAAVFESATSRIAYINGGNSGTNATSKTPTGVTDTVIGAFNAGAAYNHTAVKIAEVGIWDVALTAEEVAALADGVSPLLIRPANLVKYVPILGTASPERDFMGGEWTVTNTSQVAHPPMRYPGRVQAWKYGAAAPSASSAFAARIGSTAAHSAKKSTSAGLTAIASALGTISDRKAATAGISAISGLLGALSTTTPGTADFHAIAGALVNVTHATARIATIQAKAGTTGQAAAIHGATRSLQAIAGAVGSVTKAAAEAHSSAFAGIAGAAAALSVRTARIAATAARLGLLGTDTAKTIRQAETAAIAGLRVAVIGINGEDIGTLLTVAVSARAAYGCTASNQAAYRCTASSQAAYHCTISEAIAA